MAPAMPQGPHAVHRQPARPSTVSLAAAPGYSVSERAGDLSSAESWTVELVHSPFALAELSDGRYLAVRAARDLQEGLVELGLSTLRKTTRRAGCLWSLWLEETKWLSPFAIRLRDGGHDEAPDGEPGGEAQEELVEEAAPVQLSRLQALRQVLRLVGSLGKNARQWDAAPAAEVFGLPSHAPARVEHQVRCPVPADPADAGEQQLSDDGSDSDSEDTERCDSDEPMTPQPSRRRPSLRRGKRPLSESEAESEAEVECLTRRAGKVVRLAPEVELTAITPVSMSTSEAVRVFFKPKQIQEASSYSIPDDFDDEDERDAYRERAGRALARLREAYGLEWIRGARPKDERALRSMREEVIDIVSRCAAKLSRGEGERAEGRPLPADSFAMAAAGGEKDSLSGAAALSTELQLWGR
ncbi:MAG: hypothetical protein SGPRY_013253, partial [Prymnesium sp.]